MEESISISDMDATGNSVGGEATAPSQDTDTSVNISNDLQSGFGNDEGDERKDGKKSSSSKGSIFHIDTTLIHTVPSSEQATELKDLGVSVFDQEEFEQGVLQQVDQAINIEEAKLARQRDEKELKGVLDDIRLCRSEFRHLQKVASSIRVPSVPSMVSRELEKKLLSVKTQKENKAKQLKKLRARHRVLSAKLSGNSDDVYIEDNSDEGENGDGSSSAYERLLHDGSGLNSAPGPSQAKETEHERLIRLGEMTPFGTFLTVKEQEKPTPKPRSLVVTDFEKFLGGKDIEMYKKHKEASKWKGTKKAKGNASQSDQGSILRGLLTPKPEPSPGQKDKVHKQDTAKASCSRDSVSPGKRKPERERIEFEPKHRKKVKEKWNDHSLKKKRQKTKMRNLTEDWESNNEGYMDDSDEEYCPDSDQEAEFDDDAYSDDEPVIGRRYARPGKRRLAEQIADGTITTLKELQRKSGARERKAQESKIRRARDDSTEEKFHKRLKEERKKELMRKRGRLVEMRRGGEDATDDDSEAVDSEEDDVDLDGGFKIPSKIWKKLYRYQKIGVKWLWELHRQKAGGILGDEMGLGKTIQMIAFLAGLRTSALPSKGFSYRGLGPVLIVCPATVLHQWLKEFHTWYPEMRVAILHESGSHSGKKESLIRDMVSCHGVVITSFSNVRLRQEMLHRYNWHYVILDEGHKIRNPDAEVTLACKQFRTPHRLILTGSPMQNNLRELWSLIDFVFPGKLGTLPVFMQQFSVPIVQGGYANASKVQVQTAYKCACILRDSISPYLLRRMKADVKQALQLPSKNEQVLFCHLSEEQTQVYEDYLASKECNLILRGEYKVFAGLITLRKICNHPDLVSGGPRIFSHQNLTDDELSEEQRYGYYKRAGKMIVVESLLKLWKQQNHRVLLFSQSKQMLDIFEDFVKDRYSYMRMDGTTTISSRQPLIAKFNSDSRIFLFLLTTRVGGLGVNLTGANRVIIYDPDWNPSTDTQARERSWRIGQNKQVTIYRLLTAGSIEEKIYHRQIFKTFLTNRVLKDPRQRRFFKSNDLFELFTLGSSDKGRSTETSAIFAGTGSEVRPNPSPSRSKVNKELILKLGKKKEDALEKAERRKKQAEVIQRELKLKRKMEADKEKVKTEDIPDGPVSRVGHVHSAACQGKCVISPKRVGDSGVQLGEVGSSSRSGHEVLSSKEKFPSASSTQVHAISSSSSSRKEKKKKKRKDAKIDGHKIPHLAKTKAYAPRAEDEDEIAKNADQDNYVLEKLFKKSGVHSALQHDNIMQSSSPDFVLVENEAERVAKEAANAVRQSRRRCYGASSGIPTWTGAAGGSSGNKLRFGGKSNCRLVENSEKPEVPKQNPTPMKKKLFGKKKMFNGDMSTATTMNEDAEQTNDMPSSKSLLNRMRARNHLQKDDDNRSSSDDEDRQRTASVGTEHDGVMTEMVEFIGNHSQVPGQATTDELLKAFESKIEKSNSAMFRSMLRQICTFHRTQKKEGFWRLKAEFL
nr:DNA excision repair protein ERCC-6-like [Lytechinus pictus]